MCKMYRRKQVKAFLTLGEIDGVGIKIKPDKSIFIKIKFSLKDTVKRMRGLRENIYKPHS